MPQDALIVLDASYPDGSKVLPPDKIHMLYHHNKCRFIAQYTFMEQIEIEDCSTKSILDVCTCTACDKNKTCCSAFDLYNTDGDCLEEK